MPSTACLCRPVSHPGLPSTLFRELVDLAELNVDKTNAIKMLTDQIYVYSGRFIDFMYELGFER